MGEVNSIFNIHDLKLFKLKQFKNDLGSVKHMLRVSDEYFDGFGEVYFSTIFFKAIKGWKKHVEFTQSLVVPCGKVRFVIFDDRKGSPSFGKVDEVTLSPDSNYGLLKIPNNLWYSFGGEVEGESLIVNCVPSIHDPKECVGLDLSDQKIPYSWRFEN